MAELFKCEACDRPLDLDSDDIPKLNIVNILLMPARENHGEILHEKLCDRCFKIKAEHIKSLMVKYKDILPAGVKQ